MADHSRMLRACAVIAALLGAGCAGKPGGSTTADAPDAAASAATAPPAAAFPPGASLYATTIAIGNPTANVNAVVFDGHYVWAALEDSGQGYVEKLSSSGAVLSTTPVGIAPLEMAWDGQKLWVTDYTSDGLTVVAASGQVLTSIQLPSNAAPEGIFFDGKYIWVANNGVGSSYSNTVSKYDPTSMALIANYPVGLSPDAIAFDGTYIWVTNSYSNNVYRLNRETGEVLASYPTGTFPLSIIYDGRNLWIGNGADAPVGTFVTGNVTKLRAYGGVNLGNFPAGSTIRGLAYDGTAIWICNSVDNTFTRLNAANGARLGTYPTGARPRALAFDGVRMWIANSSSNTVTVVGTSAQPTANSAFHAGGREGYQGPTPTVLNPVSSGVDAAYAGFVNSLPATIPAVVGTIISNTLLAD